MSGSIKRFVVGVPAVIAAFVIILYFSFNSIVMNGVETIGPKILGADVLLEEVSISMFSGKGHLKGIMIGNPEGFHTESAFKLGEVIVDIDVASILSDRMVINEIVIDAPEITYETSGGKNNIEALLENVNDFAGKSEGGEDEGEEDDSAGSEKKVQINDLIISNAKVNLSATIFEGKKITLPLVDIHLEDIGKEEEGASMSEAIKEVFTELNRKIAAAVAAPLKAVGNTVEKTVDKLKGLFGK